MKRKPPFGPLHLRSACLQYVWLDFGPPRSDPRPMCRDLASLRFSSLYLVDKNNIIPRESEGFSESVFLAFRGVLASGMASIGKIMKS